MTINRYFGSEEHPTKDGLLEEIGKDYIVIKPFDSPEWPLESLEDYSDVGGHWFIKLKEAVPIVHLRCCRQCAAESANKAVA